MGEVVVVPDSEPSEELLAVGVVAGAAAAEAATADQHAQEAMAMGAEAQQTAQVAQEAAQEAAETAYDARADIAELRQQVGAMSEGIASLVLAQQAREQTEVAPEPAAAEESEIEEMADAQEGPGKREEPATEPAPEETKERQHRYGNARYFGARAYH